jgi:23S rRNA (cytosine1962-C5)-methyltransferase
VSPALRPLDALPTPAERRLAVRATPAAVRELRHGSPWLFDGSITSVSHDGAPGDLAVVFDDHRRFVAIGLWDPASPIRVKVLHHGSPATIDAAWLRSALEASIARRATLAADPSTNAYRLVHGENDGLPGLVVDRYAGTLVAKLYTPAWFPHLRAVAEALASLAAPDRIVLRLARSVAAGGCFGLTDGATVLGSAPDGPIRVRERGLVLEVDVVRGQKTGHFLDQRDNRALVRSMAEGARVLDVFASTGGFALAAAAGGARSVHLVDASPHAIESARRNFELNHGDRAVRACAVRTTVGDAFEVLAALRRREERYDLVVLDPPSFASSAGAVPNALRAYARLTRAGVRVLEPGGVLVQASCSSRVTSDQLVDVVQESASHVGVDLVELRRTGQPFDHPIGFEQGGYLKALFARAEPAR